MVELQDPTNLETGDRCGVISILAIRHGHGKADKDAFPIVPNWGSSPFADAHGDGPGSVADLGACLSKRILQQHLASDERGNPREVRGLPIIAGHMFFIFLATALRVTHIAIVQVNRAKHWAHAWCLESGNGQSKQVYSTTESVAAYIRHAHQLPHSPSSPSRPRTCRC